MMLSQPFSCQFAVRDYECDMQGVVNNAVYQNYLEHARHEFLKSRGLDFAQLTASGIIVVVIRAEIDYRASLRSGDEFNVSVEPVMVSALRLAFRQRISLVETGRVMVDAVIVTTAINNRGRPYFPDVLKVLL
jgi:acyl-CoA thioester hydrolase